MTKVGLYIDVDTFRGIHEGVLRLLEVLSKHNIQANTFFSVGPDNMGRHLQRLMEPQSLWKMLRLNTASLYGWDILLAGTAWPGKRIGRANVDIIREAAKHHEVGLHAWDRRAWRARSGNWNRQAVIDNIARGLRALEEIIGQPVTCSAAAGWRADQKVIEARGAFHLCYSSDCHGAMSFRPLFKSGNLDTAQIPMTLPTQDEMIGRDVKAEDLNN